MLKEGESRELIDELKSELNKADPECAVAKAHQYLSNRAENLNYPKALQARLPIRSGEVESGPVASCKQGSRNPEHGGV